MRLHYHWLLVLLPYLVDKALDDGEAAGPDSVEGEEDIVSLDWDDSPRVSRHVLLLIIQRELEERQTITPYSSLTWTE